MKRKHQSIDAPQRVRMIDVARAAGVSTATVSRVLSNAGTVKPDLAERVMEAVRRTHYVPDSTGRALRRQRSDVWAVIVSDIQNPYFSRLVASIEQIATANGLSIVLCNTGEDLDRERRFIANAISQRMCGVILTAASEADENVELLTRARIATVVVDRRVGSYEGDSVLLNNVLVGRLAANHLIERGHQRVLCLFGPSAASTTFDRYLGFQAAWTEAHRDRHGLQLVEANIHAEGARQATASALARAHPPTAIYAANAVLSMGVYRAVQESGRRMPEDVSLIGTDDADWTTMVSPQVTLISQPVEEMGTRAASILLERMEDPDGEPHHVVVSPSLIERETTGATIAP